MKLASDFDPQFFHAKRQCKPEMKEFSLLLACFEEQTKFWGSLVLQNAERFQQVLFVLLVVGFHSLSIIIIMIIIVVIMGPQNVLPLCDYICYLSLSSLNYVSVCVYVCVSAYALIHAYPSVRAFECFGGAKED